MLPGALSGAHATPVATHRFVSPGWHHSPEGRGIIAHLTEGESRRAYGLLEAPRVPPTLAAASFKVFLWGRAGIGKTALAAFLSGRPSPPASSACETPGLRVTDVYWPAKVLQAPGPEARIVLFRLSLWDSGEAAAKKYAHIAPVCREGASAALLVFSFTDRATLDEVEAHLARIAQLGRVPPFTPIVVGTRYGAIAESEVSNQDVASFEAKWQIPVCRVRHFGGGQQRSTAAPNPDEVAAVLNVIVERLWAHRQKQQQQQASIDPALI